MKRSNRSLKVLGIILGLTLLSGCKNSMVLNPNKPGANTNSSRVVLNGAPGTSQGTGSFGSAAPLTYYAGITANTGFSGATAAINSSNPKQVRITLPNLPANVAVCVFTGAQYNQVYCNDSDYYLDIGEERCVTSGTAGGSITVDMARSDFNVIGVVSRSEVQQFSDWYYGNVAESAYPSMAVGQVGALMTPPACSF